MGSDVNIEHRIELTPLKEMEPLEDQMLRNLAVKVPKEDLMYWIEYFGLEKALERYRVSRNRSR